MDNYELRKNKFANTYRHIKPYLHQENVSPAINALHEMCSTCEVYTGEEHDYDVCRERPCFECFLGYQYACMCTALNGRDH